MNNANDPIPLKERLQSKPKSTQEIESDKARQFIERGIFLRDQFREMMQWIYHRKTFHIEGNLKGQIEFNHTISPIQCHFRVLKSSAQGLYEDRLNILITLLESVNHSYNQALLGQIRSGMLNLSKPLKTAKKFHHDSQDYPTISISIESIVLENQFAKDPEEEVAFDGDHFKNALIWLEKHQIDNQIQVTLVGSYLSKLAKYSKSRYIYTLMQGTVPEKKDPIQEVIEDCFFLQTDKALNHPFTQNQDFTSINQLLENSNLPQQMLHESTKILVLSKEIKHKTLIQNVDLFEFALLHPDIIYFKIIAKKEAIENIIDVKDLTVQFGKRIIINKASFRVQKGTIIGIIGESGAGKSTTIKALLGEFKYQGNIRIMGVNAKNTKHIAPFLGYVPQDLSLIYHDFTALENCIHFGRQYDLDENYLTKRSKQILRDLGILEFMDKPVGELSGGQKRRVSIAMAMVHDPPILILDEPTSGLDPMTRFDLWRYLDKINKLYGITLLVISHYLDEIEYSDKSAIYLRNVGFFDYDSPLNLKRRLPGAGMCVEITLEQIDLRSLSILEQIKGAEVVQRGERIRILADISQDTIKAQALELLNQQNIKIHEIDLSVEVDMMDYFTIFSRRLGSGRIFEQARNSRDEKIESRTRKIEGEH